MANLDLERIRQYNKKCNDYKNKLSNIMAERKIMKDNLDNLCRQLSAQLGMEVTPDNLSQVYEERSQAIMQTLESGEDILRRIEGADSGVGTGTVAGDNFANATPLNVAPNVNDGFGQATPAPQPVQSVPPKMPESTYKMPSQFGNMMGGNPFVQAGAFKGSFSDIKVDRNDVDEV